MDMQLDIELLKQLRLQKAWSQTQLAKVSGLSLRTIQRLEKSGTASLESVKAIAAVYEVDTSHLQQKRSGRIGRIKTKITLFLGGAFLAASSLFFISVNARPVMIDVNITSNGKLMSDSHLLSEENSVSELEIAGALKLVLTSKVEENDSVNIFTELYDLSTGEETLIAAPIVVAKHQENAVIRVGNYELSLTPNL